MSRLALLAVAAAWAGGCSLGSGSGTITGTLFVDECSKTTPFMSYATDGGVGAPFNLHPSFFVAEPLNAPMALHQMNRLGIRIQSTGNQITEADVVFLNIADIKPVADAVTQPMPVGPNTNIRATMVLNQTCPAHQTQLELDGAITFERFGTAAVGVVAPENFNVHFGEPLTASFSFDVVDRRAIGLGGSGSVSPVPTVSGHLDGAFDFIVRQGRAAQAYP